MASAQVTQRIRHQAWDDAPRAAGPFKDLVAASFREDGDAMRAILVAHPEVLDEAARRLSPWSLRELFLSLSEVPRLQEEVLYASTAAGAFGQAQLLRLRRDIPLPRQQVLLTHAPAEVRSRLERVAFGDVALPNLPPTISADRVRLEADKEGISPLIRTFVDAHQFGPRIAAVREGEPGLALDEQAELRKLLGNLDKGQRKALRDAMLAQHPLLKQIASHPSVKGPPTVEALLAILAGRPFGKIPPMSVALRAEFDDVIAELPKNLSVEKWTERLLSSKDLILYAATYPDDWRRAAEVLSHQEIEQLQLGDFKHGSQLRTLDWRLTDKSGGTFEGIRKAIDELGLDRFSSFIEHHLSFAPGYAGMSQLLGFKHDKALEQLGLPKFVHLIESIANDQRTSFLHRAAIDHGFDTIIQQAKNLDDQAFVAWLRSPPPIDAASAPPPQRVALSGGSLGTPVALDQSLIQRARKWPADQSARYGAEMAVVVTELQGKLGREFKSFEATLAFLGTKVGEVAERVLPKDFARGLLDPPGEGRASWGRPRTSLRYSFFPTEDPERLDRLLGEKGVWVNGAGGSPLTIASRMPQGPLLFHTAPAEIPALCKLVEPAFARALAARDPEEVVAAVAEVHWWAANIMPFERGSAGAIDALAKAMLKRHGVESGLWRVDVSPDVEAMLLPLAEFVRVYPSFFETAPAQAHSDISARS